MSENSSTNNEKTLNKAEKKTIRLVIEEHFAAEILSKIDAPVPNASQLDEIVLIIKK